MTRLLRSGLLVMALAIVLVALVVRADAQPLLDFVTFDGVDYIRWAEEPGRPLVADDLGVEFAMRALDEANHGVALLLRSNWMESAERYKLFQRFPPHAVAVFSERVPMVKGRWDPDASTATSYSWFCWLIKAQPRRDTRLMWIPPGQRKALERPDDRKRFAA